MLKRILISLSKANWAKKLITHWGFARRVVLRFVAGETLADAVKVVKELNSAKIEATLDFLGENSENEAETIEATSRLMEVLDAIHQNHLRANLSIKLSQVGLSIDEELCRRNLEKILLKAREYGLFVRMDMEDSPLTERTIATYEWAVQKGYTNTGIVLQSYLYRTREDLQRLAKVHARVRLVKGAYQEPATIAYPKKEDVDANYDRLASMLLEVSKDAGFPLASEDGITPPIPAIATHASRQIEAVIDQARLMQVPQRAMEFQMLYGIRQELQQSLVKQGYPVRVYVPFGTHWYPYFMRRLAERPANLTFFLSSFLKR